MEPTAGKIETMRNIPLPGCGFPASSHLQTPSFDLLRLMQPLRFPAA
jgi:hypothetical protein